MDRLSIRHRGRPQATVLSACVNAAFVKALACDTRLQAAFLAQGTPGFPGPRFRGFINNLVGAVPGARYLEIGSGAGFAAYAAIYNNIVVATCIDEWSRQPDVRAVFVALMASTDPRIRNVAMIDADARTVDFTRLPPANIYLYDKTRAPETDGLKLALPALNDEFVFITNRWNDPQSKASMDATVASEGLSRLFAIEIRTTDDGTRRDEAARTGDCTDDFFVGVFRKPWTRERWTREPWTREPWTREPWAASASSDRPA